MTAVNPPFALQNAGATHTAENDRMMLSGLLAGARAAGSMVGRGGVTNMGNQLKVQAQGSPAMAVDVLSGQAHIPGTLGGTQGVYACTNNGTVALSITTAHATLPRIDIVVAKIEDTQYAGGVDAWSLAVVAGTPAASPVAPTEPANCIRLANIAVGAGVTSIVNGNITDTRFYSSAAGGVILTTSTARPAVTTLPNGQLVFESDTNRFSFNRNGTYWPLGPLIAYKSADESLTSTTTLQNDDHLVLPVDINATYIYKIYWLFVANNAVDIKFDITLPAGASFAPNNAHALETWPSGTNNFLAMTPSSAQLVDGGNNTTPDIIWGTFSTAGTAGNIQFRWAPQVSSGTATTTLKGSWMELIRVA